MKYLRGLASVFSVLALGLLLSSCAVTARTSRAPELSSLAVVQDYLAALNRRDLLALTAYVAPDVEWYTTIHGERTTEVSSREALAGLLKRYFSEHSYTQWTIEQSTATGSYLAVVERSEWRDDNAAGSRTSVCVYELADSRIRRITYFLAAQ